MRAGGLPSDCDMGAYRCSRVLAVLWASRSKLPLKMTSKWGVRMWYQCVGTRGCCAHSGIASSIRRRVLIRRTVLCGFKVCFFATKYVIRCFVP